MLALCAVAPARAALNININAGSNLAANQPALDAFDRAANQWESAFSDPVDVNIDADLVSNLGANTLGGASSVQLVGGYSSVRDQLVADSDADDGINGSLPTASAFSAVVPSGFSLSGNLQGTKANLKALGFTGLDSTFGANDATIEFNDDFTFDFDNSDGVDGNAIDFEAVAAHELGHALGFISAVDEIDARLDENNPAAINARLLDLYRFEDNSADDPATAAEFATASRNLMPGVDAITDFVESTIVGEAAENRMSTGRTQGDGQQASHWKDNLGIGLMDPTIAFGEIGELTAEDLRSLDLIGYDFAPVPEPASVFFALPGLAALLRRQRRRRGGGGG